MFLGLAACDFDIHVERLSSRGCFSQHIYTFIASVSHMSSNAMHMNLDSSRFYQVFNLGYVPLPKQRSVKHLQRFTISCLSRQ